MCLNDITIVMYHDDVKIFLRSPHMLTWVDTYDSAFTTVTKPTSETFVDANQARLQILM